MSADPRAYFMTVILSGLYSRFGRVRPVFMPSMDEQHTLSSPTYCCLPALLQSSDTRGDQDGVVLDIRVL
jgi:hypothetical protein